MRLYHFPPAPNPARVLFYLREKGIDWIELVLIDLTRGEHRSAAHLARHPGGAVPVLELDDGTMLTESLAIIEYLEELQPDPPMIGTTPLARARTRALERFIELRVFQRLVRWVHATRSPLGLPPNPVLAEAEIAAVPEALARIEGQLEGGDFLQGEHPSIADCTLLAGLNFARFADFELPGNLPRLRRWAELYPLRHL